MSDSPVEVLRYQHISFALSATQTLLMIFYLGFQAGSSGWWLILATPVTTVALEGYFIRKAYSGTEGIALLDDNFNGGTTTTQGRLPLPIYQPLVTDVRCVLVIGWTLWTLGLFLLFIFIQWVFPSSGGFWNVEWMVNVGITGAEAVVMKKLYVWGKLEREGMDLESVGYGS